MTLVTVSIVEQDSRCVSGGRMLGWCSNLDWWYMSRVLDVVRSIFFDVSHRIQKCDTTSPTPLKPNVRSELDTVFRSGSREGFRCQIRLHTEPLRRCFPASHVGSVSLLLFNALHVLELASDRNAQDGIIR